MTISIILYYIVIILALSWMIVFPIYMKIKKKNLWDSCYALVFSLNATANVLEDTLKE